MSRTSVPRPTDAELSILRVLWEAGPCTVRRVHEVLSRERPVAYTTALKLMQIMTEKGLVSRDERDRSHVYHAKLTEEQTQRQLVRDLLDRAFGGSASKLVMQALAARRASAEELTEIRRLIEKNDEGDRQSRDLPGGKNNAERD
jgi:predicted transcriptional regulator